jgi:hypothetical protein
MELLAHQLIWTSIQCLWTASAQWPRAVRPAPLVKGSPETSPEVQGFGSQHPVLPPGFLLKGLPRGANLIAT